MGVQGINYERAGQTAYDAYCREVGGRAFNGDPLPTWQEQRERDDQKIPNAWCAAAQAVLTVFGGKGD
jgi:hypothetical protein